MRIMFKVLLASSSICMLILVFFVNQFGTLGGRDNLILLIAFTILPFILTGLSLLLTKFIQKDSISESVAIEVVDHNFLPNYFGYFFVGLSISNLLVLIVISLLLLIFSYFSQTIYFNPILLLFGYTFYSSTQRDGKKYLILSKTKLGNPTELEDSLFKKISEHTFIRIEEV